MHQVHLERGDFGVGGGHLGADLLQDGDEGAGSRFGLGIDHAPPGVVGDDGRTELAHELSGLVIEPVADAANRGEQHQEGDNGKN